MSGWSPPWKDGQKRTVCSYDKIHCTGLAADSVFNGIGDFVGLYDERLDFSSLFFLIVAVVNFSQIYILIFEIFRLYFIALLNNWKIYGIF